MKKQKPLIETNPYLSNPKKYRKALILSVASSAAIETGASVESIVRILTGKGKKKQAKKSREATTRSSRT
ncbi:MAG: hypothetical protein FJ249_09210 [Nitrospira sp.]|nr:hypothetical protein [Nitrospira sp.]